MQSFAEDCPVACVTNVLSKYITFVLKLQVFLRKILNFSQKALCCHECTVFAMLYDGFEAYHLFGFFRAFVGVFAYTVGRGSGLARAESDAADLSRGGLFKLDIAQLYLGYFLI